MTTMPRPPVRFFIRTFGCQMNESDSERIAGMLLRAGGVGVDRPEAADLIIVNTCAVREKSEEKLFSYLGRLAGLKKSRAVRIAVVGCVAQLRAGEILGKSAAVDYVFGPDNAAEIEALVEKDAARKFVSTSWSEEWHETPPEFIHRDSPVSGYVTAMEGCDNFCSYCIVPYTRGREKYRPLASILDEVRDLARKGYLEVQLLGQNVNSYRDPDSGKPFTDLLREAASIDGPEWLRFLTSHPKNFRPEIGQTMAGISKVCRELHLPLQSGSSAVLKKMKREYTREDYLGIVSRLRSLMPGISLSTDIIVGFPGETDRDFEETIEVLRAVRFSNLFSFRYSPRPMTAASKLKDSVPREEKQRRLAEVQRLQKEIQLEDHEAQVGRTMKVLCLGRGRKTPDLYAGRNEGNQVVNFRSATDPTGRFVDVRITGFGPYSLTGERTP
jgi:tRNA-2-methylthio-N6-dimethylallyladenosine synthase